MRKRLLRVACLGLLAGILLPNFIVGVFETLYDLSAIARTTYWNEFPRYYTASLAPGSVVQLILDIDADSSNAHRRWFELYVELFANWFGWSTLFLLLLTISHLTRGEHRRPVAHSAPGRQRRVACRWTRLLVATGVLALFFPVSLVGFLVTSHLQSVSELGQAGKLVVVELLTWPGRLLVGLLGLGVEVDRFSSAERSWAISVGMLAANWIGWFGGAFGVCFAARLFRRTDRSTSEEGQRRPPRCSGPRMPTNLPHGRMPR